MKDVHPTEKKKIEKALDESKVKLRSLEASLETLETQERKVKINCKDVSYKIDAFINKQIEVLEKRRKSLKDELQELAGFRRKSVKPR